MLLSIANPTDVTDISFKHSLTTACIAITVFLVLPFNAYAAPTEQEFKNGWESSSASSSCGKKAYFDGQEYVDTSNYGMSVQNNQCKVEVDCYKANRDIVSDSFSGSADQVKDLHNCDGTLRENKQEKTNNCCKSENREFS